MLIIAIREIGRMSQETKKLDNEVVCLREKRNNMEVSVTFKLR